MSAIPDINIGLYLDLEIDGVVVTDIQAITGGTTTANIVEVKHYNEPEARKLVAGKSIDAYEIVCSYVPASASYKALALLAKSNKKVVCELTLKGGADTASGSQVLTFNGIVSSKSISTEVEAVRTVTYTLAVDGGITETDGV